MDSPNTDNAPTPTETLSTLIEGYIKLRDARDVLKKEFEARTKGVTDAMEQLEGYMAQTLQALGANSVATPAGTCYTSQHVSYKVEDWTAVLQHIIDNEAWDMLERRVSKESVEHYAETRGNLPPGLSRSVFQKIGVRRA